MAVSGTRMLVVLFIIAHCSYCLILTRQRDRAMVSSGSIDIGTEEAYDFNVITDLKSSKSQRPDSAWLRHANELFPENDMHVLRSRQIKKRSTIKSPLWSQFTGANLLFDEIFSVKNREGISHQIDRRLSKSSIRYKRSVPIKPLRSLDFHATSKCPFPCRCLNDIDGTISLVDCDNKALLEIPNLPLSATEVRLENNKIQFFPCSTFKNMMRLKKLNLSINSIQALANCSFADLISLEHLRLSRNLLTSLPARVFESLHQLQRLDLSRNTIHNLDADLFLSLRKLSWLSLFSNRLSKIQSGTFKSLGSLIFLSLQQNMLRYLPGTFEDEAFLGLTSLQTLHLEANQPDFPENFSYPDTALARIPTLHHLWLDGHPAHLGPGFSPLVNLTHLSFAGSGGSFCSMGSKIPPNFLTHLTTKQPLHLNMSSCSFQFIPPELFQAVPTLYSLDLSSNDKLLIDGFETASKGLANSTLTVLNITGIGNQRQIFMSIKNTTFFYLRHTQLKVLVVEKCYLLNIAPQAILDLPQTVEYISFHDNYVNRAFFLATLIYLRNLKEAQLSRQVHYSRINDSVVYEDIALGPQHKQNRSKLYNGKQVSFKGNKSKVRKKPHAFEAIKENLYHFLNTTGIFNTTANIHSSFCGDSQVADVNSNDKQFDEIIPIPLPLPEKLELMNLSDVRLGYNIPAVHFVNNHVLKVVDFSANLINCFGGPIYGLPSLQFLDLSRCWCFKLNPQFFIHLRSLKTLLLYKNRLGRAFSKYSSNVTFSSLVNLEHLDLSENVIEYLTNTIFINNAKLRILNLSTNELTQFEPRLLNNRKLEKLDLSHNLLTGLSESKCRELYAIRESSPTFIVRISGNDRFLCNCDNLFFLKFLLEKSEIFEDVEEFYCQLPNKSYVGYANLARLLPQLGVQCVSQSIFFAVLVTFFLILGGLSGCALYHYKRWQWKYLYYMGKSRLHMDSTYLTYRPIANVYVTYDQESRKLRKMMKDVFRPCLHDMGLTTVLGEVDFGAGPKQPSIAGAVTSTAKTLVFLSENIFQDYHRQFEVNLAIMHELYLRKPVLIPVLLLEEDTLRCPGAQSSSSTTGKVTQRTRNRRRQLNETVTSSAQVTRRRPRHFDDFASFQDLIRKFPPEISTFLKGQIHRCIVYTGDTDIFWNHLKTIILDEQN